MTWGKKVWIQLNVAVVSSNVIGGKINQMISSKQGRRELVSCHFYF